jgi:hypothetical protein
MLIDPEPTDIFTNFWIRFTMKLAIGKTLTVI